MEYKMFHFTTLSEKKFLLSFLMFALRIKCLLKLIISFYENEQTFFPTGVCLSIGEGNGELLQYSCLENSVDRGAWWAAVHGVAQSRT